MRIIMNEIEAYLHENPELLEKFMENNQELLNTIKDRFAGFIGSGDLISRFLLCTSLFEILRVEHAASKEWMAAELAAKGINITDITGNC